MPALLGQQLRCSPGSAGSVRPHRQLSVRPQAGLFGFGDNSKAEARKAARQALQDEQLAAQRAVLQRRKDDSWRKKANERRAEVKRYTSDKAYKKKVDDERRKRAPPEEDPEISFRGGFRIPIIVPVNPLGIPAYDDGERFDLKGPYAEEGWVPEDEETGLFARFKRSIGIGVSYDEEPDKTQKGKGKGKQPPEPEPKRNIFGW